MAVLINFCLLASIARFARNIEQLDFLVILNHCVFMELDKKFESNSTSLNYASSSYLYLLETGIPPGSHPICTNITLFLFFWKQCNYPASYLIFAQIGAFKGVEVKIELTRLVSEQVGLGADRLYSIISEIQSNWSWTVLIKRQLTN